MGIVYEAAARLLGIDRRRTQFKLNRHQPA